MAVAAAAAAAAAAPAAIHAETELAPICEGSRDDDFSAAWNVGGEMVGDGEVVGTDAAGDVKYCTRGGALEDEGAPAALDAAAAAVEGVSR